MKESEQDYTTLSQPVDQRIIAAVNEENVAHGAKVIAPRYRYPNRGAITGLTRMRRNTASIDPHSSHASSHGTAPEPEMRWTCEPVALLPMNRRCRVYRQPSSAAQAGQAV